MADTLPKRIETTIKSINQDNIQLNNIVPAGMSGLVVHNYGNGLSAITHSVISIGNGNAKILPYTAILHENIPTIKTEAKINDKVILGNFYDNALVIAPNEQSYSNITKRFKKTWIHPDAYALYFIKEGASEISLDSLKDFAIKNQIGLVLIQTKTNLVILDPISKKFLGQKAIKPTGSKVMKPFFSRFKHMDISAFGFSDIKLKDYYKSIQELK